MDLDNDTIEALGHGSTLEWWAAGSGAHLTFSRARPGARRSRDGWTAEDWRAYWRELKAARRRARPEVAREEDTRRRIRDGGVRWDVYVARKRRLAELLADERAERKRAAARWRALMVSHYGWVAPIERVIAGLEIDRGHW